MGFCSVKWCGKSSKNSNYKKNGITFHRFPKSPAMKSKWIDATHRGETWYPSNLSVICSRHFTADCFLSLAKQRRRLLNSAIPTLRLPVLADHSVEEREQKQLDVDEGTSTSTILDSTLQKSMLMTTSNKHDSVTHTSTTKKEIAQICVCDPDTPSACDTTVVKRLSRRIVELQSVVKEKNVQLRKLQGSNKRLKEKVIALKSLLEERLEKD